MPIPTKSLFAKILSASRHLFFRFRWNEREPDPHLLLHTGKNVVLTGLDRRSVDALILSRLRLAKNPHNSYSNDLARGTIQSPLSIVTNDSLAIFTIESHKPVLEGTEQGSLLARRPKSHHECTGLHIKERPCHNTCPAKCRTLLTPAVINSLTLHVQRWRQLYDGLNLGIALEVSGMKRSIPTFAAASIMLCCADLAL